MPCRPCVNMAVREKVRDKYGLSFSLLCSCVCHRTRSQRGPGERSCTTRN